MKQRCAFYKFYAKIEGKKNWRCKKVGRYVDFSRTDPELIGDERTVQVYMCKEHRGTYWCDWRKTIKL